MVPLFSEDAKSKDLTNKMQQNLKDEQDKLEIPSFYFFRYLYKNYLNDPW